MCVSETGGRLIANVRLEPQVSLPEGTVRRHSAGHKQSQHESVAALKVDRFPVTNGDFM